MSTVSPVRQASVTDAATVAALLDAFNREYDTASPGVEVLTTRLGSLLAQPTTWAFLGGDPPCAVALVTLRSNVWYPGPVALLDELYVAPAERGGGTGSALVRLLLETARAAGVSAVEINVDEGDVDALRFYRRHGFVTSESGSDERALFVWQELDPADPSPPASM